MYRYEYRRRAHVLCCFHVLSSAIVFIFFFSLFLIISTTPALGRVIGLCPDNLLLLQAAPGSGNTREGIPA